MWSPVKAKSELSEGALLLLVAFLLVNARNGHLSLVLASVVQGDAVNRNNSLCNAVLPMCLHGCATASALKQTFS